MKTPEFATDINVDSKTPEEIKKGLEICSKKKSDCNKCPYNERSCVDSLLPNALAYIQHLESRLAQAERERDAAVEDFTRYINFGGRECDLCRDIDKVCTDCEWVWRGVKTNDNC